MKAMLFVVLSLLFASCDLVTINTNLPFFNRPSFEIVNTSDYDLEVSVGGRQTVFYKKDGSELPALASTMSGTVFFWNWSGRSAQSSVTVKAWRKNGTLVGAASKRTWLHYNYQTAEVWIVDNATFRK